MDKNYFCAKSSLENKDGLIGTASGFNKLLLIEYNETFEDKAFVNSNIDELVKQKIQEEFIVNSDTRLLLIKRDNPKNINKINVFAIYNDYNNLSINHFMINAYSEFLEMDLEEIFKKNNYSDSFYLVCTNGKKDKCCGKFGMKIYKDLISKNADVWQCTHVGGDRFAPNIIAIPSLINYGHVENEDLQEIIDCTNKKEVYLKKYRGSSSLSLYNQAAEGFIRERYNIKDFKILKFINSERINAKQILSQFNIENEGEKIILVTKEKSDYFNYLSCKQEKQKFSFKYNVKEFNEHSKWRFEIAKKLFLRIENKENLVSFFIGGSVSKNYTDEFSDLEICFVWKTEISENKRKVLYSEMGFTEIKLNKVDNIRSFEDTLYFNKLQIDIWHLTETNIQNTINSVVIENIVDESKSNLMNVFQSCIPLFGIEFIENLKNQTETYPNQLVEKMILKHTKMFFKVDVSLQIKRKDWAFVHRNIGGYLIKIFLVLETLNKQYHSGTKRMDLSIEKFEIKPHNAVNVFREINNLSLLEAWNEVLKLKEETIGLIKIHYPKIDLSYVNDNRKNKRMSLNS